MKYVFLKKIGKIFGNINNKYYLCTIEVDNNIIYIFFNDEWNGTWEDDNSSKEND